MAQKAERSVDETIALELIEWAGSEARRWSGLSGC
jgi:hypothetical protein